MLLDPFYGVFTFGKHLSRWLNRLLILAEVVGIILFVKYYDISGLLDIMNPWLTLAVVVLIIVLGVPLINTILRFLWNVVLTFIYGTTDANTILELRESRLRRRRDRRQRRINRQTSDWTRAQIINSRTLDNQTLLQSPSLDKKTTNGRKALQKL